MILRAQDKVISNAMWRHKYILFVVSGAVVFSFVVLLRHEHELHEVICLSSGENTKDAPSEEQERSSFISTLTDCPIEDLSGAPEFFRYIRRPKAVCRNWTQFGGVWMKKRNFFDGEKLICRDKSFRIEPDQCIVLSFGINSEWSFEDEVEEALRCKIYAFDPTMDQEDHQRSPNIFFYNLGISSFTGMLDIKKKKCTVDRYSNIVRRLNLSDANIDYLKMDVEKSEIDFLEDILENSPELLANVKQIGMEIHPGTVYGSGVAPKIFRRFFRAFKQLECHGFQIISSSLNDAPFNQYRYKGTLQSSCYEIVWINVRFTS